MGMGPCVLASGSNQVLASISVIKKGTSLHPSHEPVLTSTRVPSSSLFHQKVGRAGAVTLLVKVDAERQVEPLRNAQAECDAQFPLC